mgnify:CR=1 FL=1
MMIIVLTLVMIFEMMKMMLVGWEGMKEEDGQDIPFNNQNLKDMMEDSYWLKAVSSSYTASLIDENVSIGTKVLGGDQAAKLFIFEDDSSFGNTGIHIENAKSDDAAVIVLEGARTSTNDTAQVVFRNSGDNVCLLYTSDAADE